MLRKIMVVMGLVVIGSGVMMAASTDTLVNVLVTPIVTITLTASPTHYDFGNVDLETSSNSVTAIVLTNDGNCGVTLQKALSDTGDWDITVSSTATDGFDLFAMTSTDSARPGLGIYTVGDHRFVKGVDSFNDLESRYTSSAEDMDPYESVNLWFRIDMPKLVSTSAKQTLEVTLRANSK